MTRFNEHLHQIANLHRISITIRPNLHWINATYATVETDDVRSYDCPTMSTTYVYHRTI